MVGRISPRIVSLFVIFPLMMGGGKLSAGLIYGTNKGWEMWQPLPGWSWGLSNGLLNAGWGRYEIWDVTGTNNGQPYIWYSGQAGPGDEAYYSISKHGYNTPGIKSDHLWGPTTAHHGEPKTHSMDFTTEWSTSQGVDLTSSLTFSFGLEFEAGKVGASLGFEVLESATFSASWQYGEKWSHHFDLTTPEPYDPPGATIFDGHRTRDFFLDYRGALWAWSGKLRGVVYDDSAYSVLDNYTIPPGDPDVFVFHFERSGSQDVYTEQHQPCGVPEPASYILFSTGLLTLVFLQRLRTCRRGQSVS